MTEDDERQQLAELVEAYRIWYEQNYPHHRAKMVDIDVREDYL